jgi:hypothetical protein
MSGASAAEMRMPSYGVARKLQPVLGMSGGEGSGMRFEGEKWTRIFSSLRWLEGEGLLRSHDRIPDTYLAGPYGQEIPDDENGWLSIETVESPDCFFFV